MKRTEWYPMSIKPVHEGWYEIGLESLGSERHVIPYLFPYHYWDGIVFRGPSGAPEGKALTVASYLDEADYWRGMEK